MQSYEILCMIQKTLLKLISLQILSQELQFEALLKHAGKYTEPKTKAKGWQKSTTIDFSFIPLCLRGSFKELGDTFTFGGGIFTFYFHCTNLKCMNSQYHSASGTMQKGLLKMFIDASRISLRSLTIRAGRNFEYPSWRLGMGTNLTSLPLSLASLTRLFLIAFCKVLPPLPLEGSL